MSGTLLIVAAPSGAGKTTLVRALIERDPAVGLSVSYTTRAPRSGERDGVDYNFVEVAEFLDLRERGEFIEWAEVHGNFYATSRPWLQQRIAAGQDLILEIDWQGARQVRQAFPAALGVFVLPPSLEELERRLRGRGTDPEEVVARRLLAARAEMRHVGEFDYVIINKDLSVAVDDLVAILRTARLRHAVLQRRLSELFAFLKQD